MKNFANSRIWAIFAKRFLRFQTLLFRPAITDYIGATGNPVGVFRTLGEVSVERDPWGVPTLRAGNSAAVFTFFRGGERRFLKCYIRPNPHLREVYGYIERHRPALLPRVRLLRDELWVHTASGGGRVDVVEGPWVEGETLTTAIVRAARAGDTARLEALDEAFDALWAALVREEWAHGDLKPDNIIVSPGVECGGRVTPTLTLIDCDAMWIPGLNGQKAAETGTPGWRHPDRTENHFDKTIDRFPAALIALTLKTLARNPALHLKYGTAETPLVTAEELVKGDGPAMSEIGQLFLPGELKMVLF